MVIIRLNMENSISEIALIKSRFELQGKKEMKLYLGRKSISRNSNCTFSYIALLTYVKVCK